MNDKLLSMLGMCRRAGKLVIGYEKSAESIKAYKAELVLVASDTAARTEKELRFVAKETVAVIRLTAPKEDLSHAIGTPAGVVTVTDAGFASKLQLLIQEGGTNI
jgi:ribosomal protein L7Ae-like RNA K-turn-binding protein